MATGNNENSVITRIRRIKLCQASSNPAKPLAPITHIAIGCGGVDAAGNPTPPGEEQTALNQKLAQYPIGGYTYPVETTVRYAVTIPADELSGESINEAALVDADGDLAAIKTMFTKRKDAGVIFTFEFDDEF